LVAEAIALELTLFDQERRPDARSCTYRVLAGRVPVALSAPHAMPQPRPCDGAEGALHRSEPFTGPLAIQLHRATGAWAIYATRTARTDPNRLPSSTYKRYGLQALVVHAAPRLILDLHGAQTRRFAVAIGTSPALRVGRSQALIDRLAAWLDGALDGDVVVDPPAFQANGAGTVTAHCWATLDVPAVQLEISRAYRSPRRNPGAYAALFVALQGFIGELTRTGPDVVSRAPAVTRRGL
jgi:hypothetical protein